MALPVTRRERCRAYYLEHPDASISDVSKAIGTSTRTAAQARTELVAEGKLTPGRNSTWQKVDTSAQVPTVRHTPEPNPNDKLLDDKALRILADMPLIDGDDDDEETRKKLLREVRKLAFSPDTHPDTRLSATGVWLKLKDMAKSRTDGPGKPLTRAAATSRLVNLFKMVGPDISIAAMYEAFNVKEPPNEGQVPDESGKTPSGAAGPPPAPRSDPPIQDDVSPTGPQ